MIYMVEHVIGDPAAEIEWNTWYSGYLEVLLKVPGFETAQRFIITGRTPASYMAMYTLASASVFDSDVYKASGGGGSASARFRPAYVEWRRNLFDAQRAPAVPLDHVLAVIDSTTLGSAAFTWLTTVGLHWTTPYRGLAVVPAADRSRFSAEQGNCTIYTPLTAQMTALRH